MRRTPDRVVRRGAPIALTTIATFALAACQQYTPPVDAPPPAEPGDGAHVEVDATTVAPGGPLPILAEGFPPDTPVQIGVGQPDSEYSVIAQATTDADGRVETTIDVPGWAMAGTPYVVVVAQDGADPRAVSEPFVVASPGDAIEVVGTLTDEGVECPAVRGVGGELYTLATDDVGWPPGTDVRVEGRVAEVSLCMQGTTLEDVTVQRR